MSAQFIVSATAVWLAAPTTLCIRKVLSLVIGCVCRSPFGRKRSVLWLGLRPARTVQRHVTAHHNSCQGIVLLPTRKKKKTRRQCPLLHCGIGLGKTDMSVERRTGFPIVLGSRYNTSHSLSAHSNLIGLPVVLKNESSSKLSLL